VLDLLARIHAQRGEFAEADACWARVAEMTPRVAAGTAAGAGRRRIAALQAGRHRSVTGRRLGAAALALVAAGAVAAGAVLPRPPGQDPAVRRDLAAVRDGQARLARQLGALRARVDAVADRPAPAPPAPRPDPDPDLSGPGTTVTPQGASLLVVFDEGLFGRDAVLTPAGGAALRQLGARLRRLGLTGPLVVTGHTDDTPLPAGGPYADRITLGFARAQTAARQLALTTGLPQSAIGLRSTGTAEPPFPDDSTANRARNNTVTVLIGTETGPASAPAPAPAPG
jgi:flagellar motor protein MotB